jgi:uncharacterized protein with von Willebrand factor type A (vWA) domain
VNPPVSRNGATMLPRGFLADNVLHFVRVLRAAGMPVGPAKVIDAIAAIEAVGVANKTDFREALAAVLVSRHEQIALFEQAFDVFWRNPKLLEKMVAAMLPACTAGHRMRNSPNCRRDSRRRCFRRSDPNRARTTRMRSSSTRRLRSRRARCCRPRTSRR